MNPTNYELWHEHFSGVIRMNPRWDAYDRLALELFRKQKAEGGKTLKVIEFGYTPKKAVWAADRCFTQQMQWMVDQGFADCLALSENPDVLQVARKDFPKIKAIFMPPTEPGQDPNDWFSVVFAGKPEFILAEADLILLAEPVGGIYDWSKLKVGTLIACDNPEFNGKDHGLKHVVRGRPSLWRKV